MPLSLRGGEDITDNGLTIDGYLDVLRSEIIHTINGLDKSIDFVESNPGNIIGEMFICREALSARKLLNQINELIWKAQNENAINGSRGVLHDD